MRQDPKELLKRELAEVSVADEQGWLEYVPLAARLAALGDPGPLKRWPELAEPFKERLESLLIERSEEGLWDLDQSVGQDLAMAVIDAQDFYCFLKREGGILPKRGKRMLAEWIESAERTALDEEAAALLRRFLKRFPLPPKDCLAIVAVPMSFTEESILAAAVGPLTTVDVQWPQLQPGEPALAEIAQLDAGAPSDRLKRQFERLNVRVEIPSIGELSVSRRIDECWRVVIDIGRDDEEPPEIELVRLGNLPARSVKDSAERWLVDLRPWQHMQRLRLMEAPLVVSFPNGCRLRVR